MPVKMTKLEKLELEELKWQEKAEYDLQKVAEIQKEKREYLDSLLLQTAREVYATDGEIASLIDRLKGECKDEKDQIPNA